MSIQPLTIKKAVEFTDYYAPDDAPDIELIDDCIDGWLLKSQTESGTSGANGSVHLIEIKSGNGPYKAPTKYYVKGIQKNYNSDYLKIVRHEIALNIEFTKNAGEYVSKFVGGKIIFTGGLLQSFLIFEYLNGSDLFDYIRKVEISLEKASKIYCSVKRATNTLNKLGYIHRDIKPENIFVVLNDVDEFVKCILIDFDTVLKVGEGIKNNKRYGTPEYMPGQLNQYWSKNANAYRDDFSLNTIWTEDLGQSPDDIPNDSSCELSPNKNGGRRTRMKKNTLKKHNKRSKKTRRKA